MFITLLLYLRTVFCYECTQEYYVTCYHWTVEEEVVVVVVAIRDDDIIVLSYPHAAHGQLVYTAPVYCSFPIVFT